MKNIVSGWQTRIFPRHCNSSDEKGRYYVRFWHYDMGRYCYVFDGDYVSWLDSESKRRIQRCVSTKNSEKYYICRNLPRDTPPLSNYDIDHFVILENGKTLAVPVVGDGAFEISDEEYHQECWID